MVRSFPGGRSLARFEFPVADVGGPAIGQVLGDGYLVQYIQSTRPGQQGLARIRDLRPIATQTTAELWRPGWTSTVGLAGPALAAVTEVQFNGEVVEVRRESGWLLVPTDDSSAEARITLRSPLGEWTLELPTTVPYGHALMTLKTDFIRVARAGKHRLNVWCGPDEGTYSEAMEVPARGVTLVRLVPGYDECTVGASVVTGSQPYTTVRSVPPDASPSTPATEYEMTSVYPVIATGERHFRFEVQGRRPPLRQLSVAFIPWGRRGVDRTLVLAVDCGNGSRRVEVRAFRVVWLEARSPACSARVVDDAGARQFQLIAANPARSFEVRFGRMPTGHIIRIFGDIGGGHQLAGSTVGAPGGRSGSGSVLNVPVDWDGLPVPSEAVELRPGRALGSLAGRANAGTAVARGDLNEDGLLDLVVGSPGATRGGQRGAGAVSVLLGREDGSFSRPRVLDQGSLRSRRVPEAGAGFGAALAIADLDADGYDDVAVGAPGATVAGATEAGLVTIFGGGPRGLGSARARVVSQEDLAGEQPERRDRFGSVLSADQQWLMVGVPDEDVGAARDAGVVMAISVLADESLVLDGAAVGGSVVAGDRLGQAVSVALPAALVGSPGRDARGARDAGAAYALYLDPNQGWLAVRGLTQDAFRGEAGAEAGDRFGASVAIVQTDSSSGVFIAVGAPGENDGSGVISLAEGSLDSRRFSITGSGTAAQGVGPLPASSSDGEGLGSVVVLGRFGDLLFGVPDADTGGVVDAGKVIWLSSKVVVVDREAGGLPGAPGAGDRLGATIAG